MKHPMRRVAVAIAASATCLFALATPASAATVNVELVSGDITVGSNIFPVGGGGVCTSPTTITVDVSGGNVSLTNLAGESVITVGSNNYYVSMEENAYGYSGSMSGGSITSLGAGVTAKIYNAGTGCAPTGSVLCTGATVVDLSGTYTGTGTALGDDFDLSGSDVTGGLQADPTCNAGPFPVNTPVSADIQGEVV